MTKSSGVKNIIYKSAFNKLAQLFRFPEFYLVYKHFARLAILSDFVSWMKCINTLYKSVEI